MNEILVNGEPRSADAGTTVADIVSLLAGRSDGCAAAVNGGVVPRSDWASHVLQPGDRVEVLTAVQGG
jgi:sulfur carrier protein